MNSTSPNKIHSLGIFVLTKEDNFMLGTIDKMDDPDEKRQTLLHM